LWLQIGIDDGHGKLGTVNAAVAWLFDVWLLLCKLEICCEEWQTGFKAVTRSSNVQTACGGSSGSASQAWRHSVVFSLSVLEHQPQHAHAHAPSENLSGRPHGLELRISVLPPACFIFLVSWLQTWSAIKVPRRVWNGRLATNGT